MQRSTLINLIGKRYGRLIVFERATSVGIKPVKWHAQCDCGQTTIVDAAKLRGGRTQSCGCLAVLVRRVKALKHGMRNTSVYYRWRGMLNRCKNSKVDAYPWYGGRGIKVCTRWLSFANFIKDMGLPPRGMELDRIDSDGNYIPENCRWVSHQVNCQNMRRS